MKYLLQDNINRLWASTLIDFFCKSGITQYYIAPGLRNAPIISSAIANPQANTVSSVDERSMAFRALGYSKLTGRPSVLVCTSGSALTNFFPAIIEANETQTPLIVLSADRPQRLIDAGDNQTIEQKNIFSEHVCVFKQIPLPDVSKSALELIGPLKGVLSELQGPIHLNFPFDGNLDGTNEMLSPNYIESFKNIDHMTDTMVTKTVELESAKKEFKNYLEGKENIIFCIGELKNNEQKKHILNFIKENNYPAYIDITSGLKGQLGQLQNEVPSFDHPEVFNYFKSNSPSLIVGVGGRCTSKHLYRFINENNIDYIQVNNLKRKRDPSFKLKHLFKYDPFELLKDLKTAEHRYNWDLIEINKKAKEKRDFINKAPFCYPQISSTSLESLAEKNTFIGNSTVIRSFDSYTSESPIANNTYITNRGASGIEGGMAMAMGMSDGAPNKETIAFLGDVSWIHDLGSLAALSELKSKIKIVIINNQCGGIFSLLKLNKMEETLPLMETSHSINIEAVTKAFGLQYKLVDNKEHLSESLKEEIDRPIIIEAKINNFIDLEVYESLKTLKL